MAGDPEGPAVTVRGVWKVFGNNADKALPVIQNEGLDKAAALERFDCVVGVADASFDVRAGEIFCVMGLSGSGKSTLVRHLNRLLEPTVGEVLIDGEDIMAMDDERLRRLRNEQVAMVFQNFGLMPHRTVRDNVAMPLEIRGAGKAERWETAERVLGLVELSGWEDRYAHELSGGMQQRVGLARALASDPSILLMDEPFSALDPLIRRQLQEQFMTLAADLKKTTVFITHDLDEAIRLGDRIAIMKDGRIVQTGTPQDIVLDPADDYVADFVSGISRLNLVFAESIMQPVAAYENEHGPLAEGLTVGRVDNDLHDLIDLATTGDGVVVIADEGGNPVGVVDRVGLLTALKSNQANVNGGEQP